MQFDMSRFAVDFQNTVDWMLRGEYGSAIEETLRNYQKQKSNLSTNPDSKDALKLLVETKLTNGFWRPLSHERKESFEADFDSFFNMHQQDIRTPSAIGRLTTIVATYSRFQLKQDKAKEWVEKLLHDPTLKDFTKHLHDLRKRGKKSELLGVKGADHYLRDFGFWDIVPIDIHERRFLIRTGIYHAFSVTGKQDPLDVSSLQDALSGFCSHHLKGKTVQGVDLGSAPGIVDLFIWSYCSDDRHKICGSRPRCRECRLKDACLFGIASVQKASTQGRPALSVPHSQQPLATGTLANAKGRLANQYIKDPQERCLFLKAPYYKQWGNYIAGLYLTQMQGKTGFTPQDIRDVLEHQLIPQHYGKSGAQVNEILTADVRVDAPGDGPRGFPCLERVRYGVYRFVEFKNGIKRRYGQQALKSKLSDCDET